MKQKFNIVVPMAGRGSRFTKQGYTDSKPFIDVNGKPMIQRVIENLNIEFDSNYKFIIILPYIFIFKRVNYLNLFNIL